eukprot:8844431-Alexandrium_andersonii.AAC.1
MVHMVSLHCGWFNPAFSIIPSTESCQMRHGRGSSGARLLRCGPDAAEEGSAREVPADQLAGEPRVAVHQCT